MTRKDSAMMVTSLPAAGLPGGRAVDLLQSAAQYFPAGRGGLARSRGWLWNQLVGRSLGRPKTPHAACIDVVTQLLGELAANALAHTDSGKDGGSFAVVLVWDARRLRVAVFDQGGETVPKTRVPDPEEEHGRGLQIVEALSAQWGWEPSGLGLGSQVWFVMETPICPDETGQSAAPGRSGCRTAGA